MAAAADDVDAEEHEEAPAEEVNALSAGQAILQHFWNLAALDEATRVKAAHDLVEEIFRDQASYEAEHAAAYAEAGSQPPLAEGEPSSKRLEHAVRRCSPVVVYSLRRLARGLASGRQGARQGFATALTSVFANSHSFLGADDALAVLETCLEGPGQGTEAKDLYLGKMFGVGALIRSGKPLDIAVISRAVTILLEVGSKKLYLREGAAAVVLTAVRKLDSQQLAQLFGGCLLLKAMLLAKPAEATPEALHLALTLWPRLPASLVKTCSLLPANTPAPPAQMLTEPVTVQISQLQPSAAGLFDRRHLKVLLPVLMGSTSSHPRVHGLWDALLSYLVPGHAAHVAQGATPVVGSTNIHSNSTGGSSVSTTDLEALWGIVVEEGLMNSSHERKYLGLQLFQSLLPSLRAEHIPIVLSPAFLRTLPNSAKNVNTYLHASAKKCLASMAALVDRPDADAGVKMAVAAALQRMGKAVPALKSATVIDNSSKLARRLMAGLDEAGIHDFINSTMAAFIEGRAASSDLPRLPVNGQSAPQQGAAGAAAAAASEAEAAAAAASAADNHRAAAVEQLLASLRCPAIAAADRVAVLRFLITHAFFSVSAMKAAKSKVPELVSAATAAASTHPITTATRRLCAQRLITLLGTLSSAEETARRQARQRAQQQAQQEGKVEGQIEVEGAPAKKSRKEAQASPAVSTAAHDQAEGAYLIQAVAFVHKLVRSSTAQLVVDNAEEATTVLTLLRELEEALTKQLDAAATAGATAQPAGRSNRVRSMRGLIQLLQLHLLGDPSAFDVGLALELRRVAREGLGTEGLAEVEEEDVEADGEEAAGDAEPATKPHWMDVLLDILLSMLARPAAPLPSAPLRSAVEALWRSTCEELTPAGMADLVRVVSAAEKAEAGAVFDSDEEDEESEVEQSEEEEEEQEEGDEETAAAGGSKGRNGSKQNGVAPASSDAVGKAAGKKRVRAAAEDEQYEEEDAGGSGSDDDDDDEPDSDVPDDDAMFRMDDKLAAYLRSMVDGRKGAEQRAVAFRDLKLRALSLIETYHKKVPSSPLLMTALVPLLRAYALAVRPGGGGNPALAKRLAAVLGSKLTKSKLTYDSSVMTSSDLATALKKAQYFASRGPKEVLGPATDVLLALLRAAATAAAAAVAGRAQAEAAAAAAAASAVASAAATPGKATGKKAKAAAAAAAAANAAPEATAADVAALEAGEAAAASVAACLDDFFRKKKSRFSHAALATLLRGVPVAGLPALPRVVAEATASRNVHLQVEALQLLALLLKPPHPAGLAAALQPPQPFGHALGTALVNAALGAGMRASQAATAARAACDVVEGLRKLLPDVRLAEVLGPEGVSGIAKAIVAARSLPPVPKALNSRLTRLVDLTHTAELVSGSKPDPALVARITKAKPSAGAAANPRPLKKAKTGDGVKQDAPAGGKAASLPNGVHDASKAQSKKAASKKDKVAAAKAAAAIAAVPVGLAGTGTGAEGTKKSKKEFKAAIAGVNGDVAAAAPSTKPAVAGSKAASDTPRSRKQKAEEADEDDEGMGEGSDDSDEMMGDASGSSEDDGVSDDDDSGDDSGSDDDDGSDDRLEKARVNKTSAAIGRGKGGGQSGSGATPQVKTPTATAVGGGSRGKGQQAKVQAAQSVPAKRKQAGGGGIGQQSGKKARTP